jgi:hypothetical protein
MKIKVEELWSCKGVLQLSSRDMARPNSETSSNAKADSSFSYKQQDN